MGLILFDIDGTLLRTRGVGTRALNLAISEVLGVEDGMSGIRPDGKTDPQIIREALKRNCGRQKAENGQIDAVLYRYPHHFRREIKRNSGLVVFLGAYRLAAELSRRRRFHVGVATGNIEECANLKLRWAGLESLFSFGGYGSDAEDRTQLIRTAIERGSRTTSSPGGGSAVVIGDTPADILHGRQAGAMTLAVSTGRYSLAELRRCQPDLAVESLEPAPPLMEFLQQA